MSGLFLLLCSALIIIGSLRLPLGMVANPGPGFVPLLVGVLLSIISLAILINSFLQRSSEGKAFLLDKKQWPKVVTTVLMILVYTVAFPYLGFFVSTLLLMFFLFKAIGGMNWKASLVGAILTSSCFYLVFKVWLKVQFPEGPLGM
jgi:putative tricarboxylic transport membrane protein